MDLTLFNVPEDIAQKMLKEGFAEVVKRKGNQRFDLFKKLAVGVAQESEGDSINYERVRAILRGKNPLKIQKLLPNLESLFSSMNTLKLMSSLTIALSAANLVSTIAGIAIICRKLDTVDQKLNEVQKGLKDSEMRDIEIHIARPCREIVDDYKLIGDRIQKGEDVPENELITLIRKCKDYLLTLYNLRRHCELSAVLNLIFTLLPILASCIVIYYQHYYDVEQGKSVLHESWMEIFDKLATDEFLEQIQDYLFIEKGQSNLEVNEYLDSQRLLMFTYKQKIEELLEDLKACEGREGYDEAVRLSKQYAAQRAREIQADLESRMGSGEAQEIVEAALKQALA